MAFFLNGFVRLAGQLLRPNHSLDRPFKVIAVSKFKGMGSIVQATPLLQTLRLNYPDARLVFVTTPANVALLNASGLCDEIILINDINIFRLSGSVFKALGRMWRLRIQVYIDLEIYSHFSSLMTTLSLARNRFGFYLRSSNYRMGIYTHMMFYNIKAPVSRVYLQMASMLPLKQVVTNLFDLRTTIKSDKFVVAGSYVVINVNASDLRVERRWPAENFIELIIQILEKTSFTVILIGSKNEKPYVDNLSREFENNSRVLNQAGNTGFIELVALIAKADAMITNDTGPMHLAFSVKCPVVALFGPCTPFQYGQGGVTTAIYKNLYCSPCVHEFIVPPCKGNNVCMREILVDEVFDAFIKTTEGKHDIPESESILFQSSVSDFVAGKVSR